MGCVVVFWHNENVNNVNALVFFHVEKLLLLKGKWFDPTNSLCFRCTKIPKKSNALIQIQDSSCYYTQSGWSHWPSSNSRHNWFCQQMIQISRAPLDTKNDCYSTFSTCYTVFNEQCSLFVENILVSVPIGNWNKTPRSNQL